MDNPLDTYRDENGRYDAQLLERLAFNEKMAELGKLATGVIHELNTPLSVIASATQLILREEGLPEFVTEMVERINQEALRLAQMTKGLLTFTREGNTGQDTDVNQVLREVMAFLRYEAQRRSVTVAENFDFRLPSVTVDPNHLKQIFINLIMNSLQAMEQGGTLLLETAVSADGFLQVRIADTGLGMSAAVLANIFTPFYTTKPSGEGTGLGLFITQRLVEGLGGRISVESRPGEGSSFFLSIPLPD